MMTLQSMADAYLYVDCLATVPLLLIENALVMRLLPGNAEAKVTTLGISAGMMVGYPGELSTHWHLWFVAIVPFSYIVYHVLVGLQGLCSAGEGMSARSLENRLHGPLCTVWAPKSVLEPPSSRKPLHPLCGCTILGGRNTGTSTDFGVQNIHNGPRRPFSRHLAALPPGRTQFEVTMMSQNRPQNQMLSSHIGFTSSTSRCRVLIQDVRGSGPTSTTQAAHARFAEGSSSEHLVGCLLFATQIQVTMTSESASVCQSSVDVDLQKLYLRWLGSFGNQVGRPRHISCLALAVVGYRGDSRGVRVATCEGAFVWRNRLPYFSDASGRRLGPFRTAVPRRAFT